MASYTELVQSISPERGVPVVPVNLRFPVQLHARLQRAIGEVMSLSGKRVSQNAICMALIADGLARLENQSGDGSL